MWIYDTSLCFITAHLAAHQTKVKDRNDNVERIFQNLRLHVKEVDLNNQFNHIFFFGDLNYRIDMGRDEVLATIECKSAAPPLGPHSHSSPSLGPHNYLKRFICI